MTRSLIWSRRARPRSCIPMSPAGDRPRCGRQPCIRRESAPSDSGPRSSCGTVWSSTGSLQPTIWQNPVSAGRRSGATRASVRTLESAAASSSALGLPSRRSNCRSATSSLSSFRQGWHPSVARRRRRVVLPHERRRSMMRASCAEAFQPMMGAKTSRIGTRSKESA